MSLAFIGCSKRKMKHPSPAYQMYLGGLFRKAIAYCMYRYSAVYILSAKYGLLNWDQIIEPYDLSIYDLSKEEKKQWNAKVAAQLEPLVDRDWWFYTGKEYSEFFEGHKPFEGVTMGRQLEKVHMIGQRYGKLKVYAQHLHPDCHLVVCHCVCDCGIRKLLWAADLREGTKSCGCSLFYSKSDFNLPDSLDLEDREIIRAKDTWSAEALPYEVDVRYLAGLLGAVPQPLAGSQIGIDYAFF